MAESGIWIIFLGTIVVGAIASVLAFSARKHALDENRAALNFYAAALVLLALGFVVHTSGDLFSAVYANDDLEHILESLAHVIIFGSFLLIAISAHKILEEAKQYWFK